MAAVKTTIGVSALRCFALVVVVLWLSIICPGTKADEDDTDAEVAATTVAAPAEAAESDAEGDPAAPGTPTVAGEGGPASTGNEDAGNETVTAGGGEENQGSGRMPSLTATIMKTESCKPGEMVRSTDAVEVKFTAKDPNSTFTLAPGSSPYFLWGGVKNCTMDFTNCSMSTAQKPCKCEMNGTNYTGRLSLNAAVLNDNGVIQCIWLPLGRTLIEAMVMQRQGKSGMLNRTLSIGPIKDKCSSGGDQPTGKGSALAMSLVQACLTMACLSLVTLARLY